MLKLLLCILSSILLYDWTCRCIWYCITFLHLHFIQELCCVVDFCTVLINFIKPQQPVSLPSMPGYTCTSLGTSLENSLLPHMSQMWGNIPTSIVANKPTAECFPLPYLSITSKMKAGVCREKQHSPRLVTPSYLIL